MSPELPSLSPEGVRTAERVKLPTKITRRKGACESCRHRKTRCISLFLTELSCLLTMPAGDGQQRCQHCQRLGLACRYIGTQHGRKISANNIDIDISALQRLSTETPRTSLSSYRAVNDTPQHPEVFDFNNFDSTALFHEIDTTNYFSSDTIATPRLALQHAFSDWKDHGDRDGEDLSSHFQSAVDQAEINEFESPLIYDPADETISPLQQLCANETMAKELGRAIALDRKRQPSFMIEALLGCIEGQVGSLQTFSKHDLSKSLEVALAQSVNALAGNNSKSPPDIGELLATADPYFVEACISACIHDAQGVSTFLDRSVIDLAVKDKLGSPLKAGLLYSLLALRIYLLGDELQPTSPVCTPQTLLKIAMDLRLKFARQDELSIRHLQVLVVMAYTACSICAPQASILLYEAIHYVQTMHIGRSSAIENVYASCEKRNQCKNTVWFLYAIEKTFCLRTEMSPIFDADFIDYWPSQVQGYPSEDNWLSIHCYYALVCSSALKCSFGQTCLHKPATDDVQSLDQKVEAWRRLLPQHLQATYELDSSFATLNHQERRTMLGAFFQYHEAVLSIHLREGILNDGRPTPASYSRCVTSARAILRLSGQIMPEDVRSNLSILRTTCLAMLTCAVLSTRDSGSAQNRPYLAMASGFFARMARGHKDFPLHEVTRVIRMIDVSEETRPRGQERETICEQVDRTW